MGASPPILRCPECSAKNRIPPERIGRTARCGRCKAGFETEVLTEKHPIAVTDGDFETFVMKSPLPVLLDCWAAWCGPCKMVAPLMEQLAAEWKGRVRIAKLDVDQNPQTAARFQVMSVPTFLIFDKGELKDTLTGALPKGRIVDRVQPHFL